MGRGAMPPTWRPRPLTTCTGSTTTGSTNTAVICRRSSASTSTTIEPRNSTQADRLHKKQSLRTRRCGSSSGLSTGTTSQESVVVVMRTCCHRHATATSDARNANSPFAGAAFAVRVPRTAPHPSRSSPPEHRQLSAHEVQHRDHCGGVGVHTPRRSELHVLPRPRPNWTRQSFTTSRLPACAACGPHCPQRCAGTRTALLGSALIQRTTYGGEPSSECTSVMSPR